jgi:hypothetical protein
VRTILRAILAVALLLGGGLAEFAPAPVQTKTCCAHESCGCGCCGRPAGAEDRCPCPKPDGSRGPAQSLGLDRAATAQAPDLSVQGQRRTESRPEPEAWDATAEPSVEGPQSGGTGRGRDPDLGRHLARLNTFRI